MEPARPQCPPEAPCRTSRRRLYGRLTHHALPTSGPVRIGRPGQQAEPRGCAWRRPGKPAHTSQLGCHRMLPKQHSTAAVPPPTSPMSVLGDVTLSRDGAPVRRHVRPPCRWVDRASHWCGPPQEQLSPGRSATGSRALPVIARATYATVELRRCGLPGRAAGTCRQGLHRPGPGLRFGQHHVPAQPSRCAPDRRGICGQQPLNAAGRGPPRQRAVSSRTLPCSASPASSAARQTRERQAALCPSKRQNDVSAAR